MSTATNPLLKSVPIFNTCFTTPSIFIPKSVFFLNPSKPTKLPQTLIFSLQKPTLSFITHVAQTSDWEQESSNAVLEEGEGANSENTLDFGNTETQLGEELDGVEGFQEPNEDAKLYVGNLPFDVDSERLAQIFEGAGVVEISEVIYNRETDRSRGFGFVTMSTVEEAEKAVELFNRYDLNGRLLTVNKAAPRGSRPERSERPPREFAPSFRIYVGNLPWDVDNGRLEQVFSEHGKVLSARVMSDRETGRSRGFGFVTMASESEMNDAIAALDGQSLDGRAIRVNAAEERPRRNF